MILTFIVLYYKAGEILIMQIKYNNLGQYLGRLEYLIIQGMFDGSRTTERLDEALTIIKKLENTIVDKTVLIPIENLKFNYDLKEDETRFSGQELDTLKCTVSGPSVTFKLDPSYSHNKEEKEKIIEYAKEFSKNKLIHEWSVDYENGENLL